jgi:hypothetical protein
MPPASANPVRESESVDSNGRVVGANRSHDRRRSHSESTDHDTDNEQSNKRPRLYAYSLHLTNVTHN